MEIETLGEAWRASWQITARCDENRLTWLRTNTCSWQRPLDMVTLVATRGDSFPLSLVASRLRCPQCGSRKVSALFHVPGQLVRVRA